MSLKEQGLSQAATLTSYSAGSPKGGLVNPSESHLGRGVAGRLISREDALDRPAIGQRPNK